MIRHCEDRERSVAGQSKLKVGVSWNLRDFIQRLETEGELLRVIEEVDPELEITEITNRISKQKGPALLFEKVKGSSMPLLINAFGSMRRMAIALGVRDVKDCVNELQGYFEMENKPRGFSDKLNTVSRLMTLSKIHPSTVSKAPCQDVILRDGDCDLSQLPILKCWPKDNGRFITLPLVFSKDPETGERNVGVYRMQVLDKQRTAMHWQTQKDGAAHAIKSKKKKKKLEVACVIGADPSTVFAGIAPLPYGMDELLLSGFLRKKGVELVKCQTLDMEVPANAEIVLEGTVDTDETCVEGPFGDHTGVYTPPENFPVFRIQCITMRKNPIYLTTIVGKPPMEDFFMGKAVEKLFLPLLKKQMPEICDMNFPMEGTFNNAVIVSIDKVYPFQAKKTAHAIWGLGQLAFTKMVIIVDKTVDVHNISEVALNVFNNIDPKRDVFFVEGPVDTLNHASPQRDHGSKMGLDATAKWKEEGYSRVWPEDIQMDDVTKNKVTKKWKTYGLGDRTA
jgi:4-hydroxy-3-polyprenylbenzoate decarboxylase